MPRGQRVYAVGDVHGRLDLLEKLLAAIEADDAARGAARTTLVFLGDLIDRGPASAQVIERVSTYRLPGGGRVLCLCGNHEEVMIRVLRGDGDLLYDWTKFGGAECLRSYGLSPTRLKRMEPAEAVAKLKAAVPKQHAKFLQGLADTVRIGDYLFVHAGIRPGVELMSQAQNDLRWIREPFLAHDGGHGFVVVHGHTISASAEVLPNRIGIDTGAYRSGVLTAIALEGADRWFLEARADDAARPEAPAAAREHV
ncbi:MAG TPA: metallophosphoesterase [Sphingomicrobium sp.]|nr:metallophosphoesterase [Sphingomicrobium sp.]